MTNEQPLFSLEDTDLSNLLMPSWLKEKSASTPSLRVDHYQERTENSSRRFSGPRSQGSFNQDRRERGPRNGSKDRGSSFRKEGYAPRAVAPAPPAVYGWKIMLLPEQRGLDEIAKQIKTEAKAYPLFEIARLVLEKPERFRAHVIKIPSAKDRSSKLYQCRLDESLWLSEKEFVAHVLKNNRDRFYLTETIEVEPPKGAYTSVAVCGMSQTILGPSSHHHYQAKVRQLHAERFSNIPFDVFKSRIKMVRDEAVLEQWKKEQTIQETFTPISSEEGAVPEKITTLAELEAHFKKEHLPTLLLEIEEEVFLSGTVGMRLSAAPIKQALQQIVEELRRFPLPLSHLLGQEFVTRGLQIFKAHENIVYVSIARPRVLNHQETPLSPPLAALVSVLESLSKTPRAEQWKAMVAARSLSEGESEAERESAVAKDLSWLIREGYVINYALRGFALAKKPKEQAGGSEK